MKKKISDKEPIGINNKAKDITTDHNSIFQDDIHIYTKEDLAHKGAITGSKKGYIINYIKSFREGNLFFENKQTLEGLALFIYNQDLFFVNHPYGYKRMKYSRILSLIRYYSKE